MGNKNTIPFVDLAPMHRQMGNALHHAMAQTLDHSLFVGGPVVEAFEQTWASTLGSPHCVSTGNGTDALFLALKAAGIGPGMEVITAANTFTATAEAIVHTGASLVFADCDPHYHHLCPQDTTRKIGPNTKALLPVHLYGPNGRHGKPNHLSPNP